MEDYEEIRKGYEMLKFSWDERRAFARRKGLLPVRFMGEKVESYLFSVDVGGGGVRITTRKPLDPKKAYDFDLLLEGVDYPIRVKGRVVWQRPLNVPDEFYEAGLLFEEILPEDRKSLMAYAEKQPGIQDKGRRRFLRVPRLLLATVFREEREEALAGLILDISEGGSRILTSRLIPAKTRIKLKVELEEGIPLDVPGIVMWGNRVEALGKFQHGIQFVHGVGFQDDAGPLRDVINEYLEFRGQLIQFNLVETLLNLARSEREPPPPLSSQ